MIICPACERLRNQLAAAEKGSDEWLGIIMKLQDHRATDHDPTRQYE